MANFAVAERSTNGGTAARPLFSLYAPAATGGAIREIGFFNTTAVAAAYRLARLTATGTQGTALTEVEYDLDAPDPLMTAFNSHSADATVATGSFRQASIGAAVGSGVIWTFGGRGLVIPPGTANGVGLVPVGTGQVVDFYIDWEE